MSILTDIAKLKKELEEKRARIGHNKGPVYNIPDDISELTGYHPRPLQEQMESALNRFNALVCHRRFGKTVFCIQQLIDRAVECPHKEGRYAYIAPTYAMAEDIAWAYLDAFTENIPGRVVEKSKLAIWLPTRNGSRARIRLYGVDSPKQRLRGLYLDGAVIDEFQEIPMSVWTEQIRPMVSDQNRAGLDDLGRINQWVIFIGTPKGRNQFHRVYRNADLWARGKPVITTDKETGKETPLFRDNWYAAIHRASETGIIAADELADAKADMGVSKYEQEYECSFDAAVEGAIFGHDIHLLRKRKHLTTVPYFRQRPVVTGWDLGWDDCTAIWFAQIFGREIRFIDYYEARNENLSHYADVLIDRGYRYAKHYLPHDVETHELGSGKSRRSILQSLGIRVTKVPKHSLWDGIAAVQNAFPRFWFDETKCAEGLDRLALYQRQHDEKLGRFLDTPVHNFASHSADGMRSLIMGIRLNAEDDEDYGDDMGTGRSLDGKSVRETSHGEFDG